MGKLKKRNTKEVGISKVKTTNGDKENNLNIINTDCEIETESPEKKAIRID